MHSLLLRSSLYGQFSLDALGMLQGATTRVDKTAGWKARPTQLSGHALFI